ncbi:hypothetical protein GUITHDRAFT_108404 [Guillardia theta CCMP2712]|uniref:Uncharacterized protein n=1 Tax=Guillardia theta (strain CCMP2712) TaxID=905079 RepID=L1JBR2_GUITC|nr:hypothetical protein GUITHDRAFT_108404 [Guillardia theta CCMP2712]EKX45530.1 hypothetical protein GUITHDRAFT_108404 [Guillardia theta CCMP2712]|eukprot:XP_005832510.1 hypothetical protein GUITHDRAFT_108404 [Guillardia theta CCMP2712]
MASYATVGAKTLEQEAQGDASRRGGRKRLTEIVKFHPKHPAHSSWTPIAGLAWTHRGLGYESPTVRLGGVTLLDRQELQLSNGEPGGGRQDSASPPVVIDDDNGNEDEACAEVTDPLAADSSEDQTDEERALEARSPLSFLSSELEVTSKFQNLLKFSELETRWPQLLCEWTQSEDEKTDARERLLRYLRMPIPVLRPDCSGTWKVFVPKVLGEDSDRSALPRLTSPDEGQDKDKESLEFERALKRKVSMRAVNVCLPLSEEEYVSLVVSLRDDNESWF